MNLATNPTNAYTLPSVSITTACTGASSKANALGMRYLPDGAALKVISEPDLAGANLDNRPALARNCFPPTSQCRCPK